MPIKDVTFARNRTRVVMTGKAEPGSVVTAENVSAAPFAPSDHRDTFARAKAGADGTFSVVVPTAREGDQVRVQADASGRVDTLSVRLSNIAAVDGRRADVSNQKYRLVPAGAGSFSFECVSRNARAGEPGAVLQFTNARSGEATRFTVDARGRLPADARLRGEPGDVFRLAVTDGVNNASLSDDWSALVAPSPAGANGVVEPAPTRDLQRVPSQRFTGPLFVDGPSAADATQGEVGDCYLVATFASVAATHPDIIRDMVKDHGDGTYTVTFQRYDEAKQRYVPAPVTVNNELRAKGGTPAYGASPGARPAGAEMWFPVVEKAYAAWKGGYDAITCGYPYEMFEAILGVEGRHHDLQDLSAASLWRTLQKAAERNDVVVAWTGVDSTEAPFINSGVVPDHAYSVLGVVEKGGQKLVQVRNPWGSHEPAGNGPDDGVFEMKLADFRRLFTAVGAAQPK